MRTKQPVVIFGMLHGIAQRVRGDHIELPLHAALVKIALDIAGVIIQGLGVGIMCMRRELDVEGDVVGHFQVIQARRWCEYSGAVDRRPRATASDPG